MPNNPSTLLRHDSEVRGLAPRSSDEALHSLHSSRRESSPLSLPEFLRLIREDYETYDRDMLRPGFTSLVVHRFGNWRMGIRPRALRVPFSAVYKALYVGVRNLVGIEIPYTVAVGRRVVFEHQHGIVVHGRVVLGDDCVIRQGVTLGIRRMDGLDQAPVLGDRVNVGAGAKILGRVVVGDDAEIGANAVVLQDVPAGALAVGVPARIVMRERGARAGADGEFNVLSLGRGRH